MQIGSRARLSTASARLIGKLMARISAGLKYWKRSNEGTQTQAFDFRISKRSKVVPRWSFLKNRTHSVLAEDCIRPLTSRR